MKRQSLARSVCRAIVRLLVFVQSLLSTYTVRVFDAMDTALYSVITFTSHTRGKITHIHILFNNTP